MSKSNSPKKPPHKTWQLWALAAAAVCAIGVSALSGGGVAEAPASPSQDVSFSDSRETERADIGRDDALILYAAEEEEPPIASVPPEPSADAAVSPAQEAKEEPPSRELLPEPPAESAPSEPSPEPEPSVTAQSKTVYVTKTGKRYHYNNHCNGGTYYESTLEEALDRGLTPCKKCVG